MPQIKNSNELNEVINHLNSKNFDGSQQMNYDQNWNQNESILYKRSPIRSEIDKKN